jgi:hypothetical protein
LLSLILNHEETFATWTCNKFDESVIAVAMVLDPLTALSVAGTIVQFVDFSSKILSHTAEFYNSAEGALSTNEELELVTADLSNLLARLRRPLYIGGATNPPTQADQAL